MIEGFYYLMVGTSPNVFIFWLQAIPWHTGWYLLWLQLMSRYNYSKKEVFFLANVNGYIIEGLFLRQIPVFSFIGIFFYPLIASVYGVMALIPLILTKTEIDLASKNLEISISKKYLYMIFIASPIYSQSLLAGSDPAFFNLILSINQ
jgi:hypothetical protein